MKIIENRNMKTCIIKDIIKVIEIAENASYTPEVNYKIINLQTEGRKLRAKNKQFQAENERLRNNWDELKEWIKKTAPYFFVDIGDELESQKHCAIMEKQLLEKLNELEEK